MHEKKTCRTSNGSSIGQPVQICSHHAGKALLDNARGSWRGKRVLFSGRSQCIIHQFSAQPQCIIPHDRSIRCPATGNTAYGTLRYQRDKRTQQTARSAKHHVHVRSLKQPNYTAHRPPLTTNITSWKKIHNVWKERLEKTEHRENDWTFRPHVLLLMKYVRAKRPVILSMFCLFQSFLPNITNITR